MNTTCLARKDEGVDDRLPLFHPNDVLVTKLLIVYRRKVIRKARMVRSYRILHEKDFTTEVVLRLIDEKRREIRRGKFKVRS